MTRTDSERPAESAAELARRTTDEYWRERYLTVSPSEPRKSEARCDPDVLRLNPIQSALIDQLVARRQATGGPTEAEPARRSVIGEVLAEGILAIQRREGLTP